MATVTTQEAQEVSREQAIAVLVASGISAEYAKFIVAVERGETAGDCIEVDEDGNEVNDVD